MTIVLNGTPHETAVTTLEELVEALGFRTAKVATAVNGDFVPAGERAGHGLAERDTVEIVAPRAGG